MHETPEEEENKTPSVSRDWGLRHLAAGVQYPLQGPPTTLVSGRVVYCPYSGQAWHQAVGGHRVCVVEGVKGWILDIKPMLCDKYMTTGGYQCEMLEKEDGVKYIQIHFPLEVAKKAYKPGAQSTIN